MPLQAWANMPSRFLVIAAAGLAIAGIAGCDSSKLAPAASTSASTQTRQVTVIGSGEVQGTPNTLTVNASTEAVAADVTAASNQASSRMQAVIDALVAKGIDRRDISTTQVSLQQQPFIDGAPPPAYQATNAISVKIRRIDTASDMLALIQNAGGNATRINSVDFSIQDDPQLLKDARARAFNDAKDRAAQYANLSGLTLGKVISISEVTSNSGPPPPPVPMPRAYAEAAPVPLEPGQQTVSFSVTVVWELT